MMTLPPTEIMSPMNVEHLTKYNEQQYQSPAYPDGSQITTAWKTSLSKSSAAVEWDRSWQFWIQWSWMTPDIDRICTWAPRIFPLMYQSELLWRATGERRDRSRPASKQWAAFRPQCRDWHCGTWWWNSDEVGAEDKYCKPGINR